MPQQTTRRRTPGGPARPPPTAADLATAACVDLEVPFANASQPLHLPPDRPGKTPFCPGAPAAQTRARLASHAPFCRLRLAWRVALAPRAGAALPSPPPPPQCSEVAASADISLAGCPLRSGSRCRRACRPCRLGRCRRRCPRCPPRRLRARVRRRHRRRRRGGRLPSRRSRSRARGLPVPGPRRTRRAWGRRRGASSCLC